MSRANDEIKRRLANKLKQKQEVSATFGVPPVQPKRLSNKSKLKIIYGTLIFLLILIPVCTFSFVVQSFRSDEKVVKASKVSSSESSSLNSSLASSSSSSQQQSSIPTIKEILPASAILDIPLVKQIYNLSCEAATLQMALRYYGIESSQDQLLADFGISQPMVMQSVNDKIIWGDPDESFVGDVRGMFTGTKNGVTSLRFGTGLGINNGPVAKTARKFKPASQEIDGATIDQVKLALVNKNPVMMWHRRDDSHQESMEVYTRSGKRVIFQQYHVNLVTGYKTNTDGAVTFILNDPYYGRLELSETDFIRWWSRYDKQIVIVK
ncbi:MAG: C39 family peptidase [bacterium]